MSSLNENSAMHKLPIKPECKPVQQKLRRMKPKMLLKIRDEVKKQFDIGFLQAVTYSDWVANIVPVHKKDGKVRMSMDYRDLNRASPKDSFPFPHIDTMVDNTACHSYFSYMDGFYGYNQIKMCPDYMSKTTFVTLWGTFCYKVMPFGLKNAGATYQRTLVVLFRDMMHKEIEVYVDDMIAKSRTEEEHITNLEKLFQRLREFHLKLNPVKCTFGVTSGKFLGFIVSKKGIEIYPDKVRAIQELPPPKTQKEVRVWATKRLRQYMLYHTTLLISKLDPLKYMMEAPAFSGRLARWHMLLSEFDILYVSRKAIKGSAIADFLVSRALEDYESLDYNFSNEDLLNISNLEESGVKKWILYFDRASNSLGRW
ncbi:hypothetical protein V6N12_068506 [Hibiscus sabdariffa]|uniref:Reverse transcriptase domain-containing protein n=1 Tax=Hibiscus sabdariffa TaxID=183260 RepID=A0ABR2FQ48_9ROSI